MFGLGDTKDWSNGAWKFSFVITGIDFKNIYINIKQKITIRVFFQTHLKNLTNPKFWTAVYSKNYDCANGKRMIEQIQN